MREPPRQPDDGRPTAAVAPTATATVTTGATAPVTGTATAKRRARTLARRTWVPAVQLALLAALLGAWQLGVETKGVDVFFFGSPAGTWRALYEWVRRGTLQGPLWQQAWVTLQETLLGFGVGVLLGVVFGVLLGRITVLARVFTVYIGTLNAIPRIVLGSVFVIWFGLGMGSKVALSILLVFFSVFFNAFQGAREVDRNLVANA